MLFIEVQDERVKGFEHVVVAQIPRRDLAAKHCSVILLGVLDEPGVLFGKKEFTGCDAAIARKILSFSQAQFD